MLKRLILIFALLLSACGTDWEHEGECFNGCDQPADQPTDEQPRVVYSPGPPGPAGQPGKDGVGKDGKDGVNGTNGHSSVFLIGPATALACPAGGSTMLVALDTNDNGVLDILDDANLQSATICNGSDGNTGATGATGATGDKGDKGDTGDTGADGQDAPPTQFTPVAVLDPCGDDVDVIDEVLLRLADGTILASLSDQAGGKNTRFVIIEPGDYQTTDDSKCYFSVDASSNLFDEHY